MSGSGPAMGLYMGAMQTLGRCTRRHVGNSRMIVMFVLVYAPRPFMIVMLRKVLAYYPRHQTSRITC